MILLKKTIKLSETRTLVMLKGYYDQGSWLFKWEGGQVSLRNTPIETITSLLMKSQVKDAATQPRSARNKTYAEIANGIQTGSDRLCFIWSNDLITFKNIAQSLGGIF